MPYHRLKREYVIEIISRAIEEDVGTGDITSLTVLPTGAEKLRANVIFKQAGVLCGIDIIKWTYGLISPKVRVKALYKDGDWIERGASVAVITGPPAPILMGERIVLNFLSRLSGISTITRKYVEKLEGTGIALTDTRKTIPSMRLLEKYAVFKGGGQNHRIGLFDQILIKDNHLQVIKRHLKVGDEEASLIAIKSAKEFIKKKGLKNIKIEIEVDTESAFEAVKREPVDIVMLDNMPFNKLCLMAKALKAVHPSVIIEVSGGLLFDHLDELKDLPIDRISVGAITHSVKAIDISMDV